MCFGWRRAEIEEDDIRSLMGAELRLVEKIARGRIMEL